jgi:hypothetical protein
MRCMSKTGTLLIHALALTAMAACAGSSAAGHCTDSREHYVAVFEAGPAHEEFSYALTCVMDNSDILTPLWAGKLHAARFAAARADTMVPRLREAARRLLALPESPNADWRLEVLQVAAAHGIARVDSLDVFAELFTGKRRMNRHDYALMAILQDCRAVPILRERYLELRADPAATDTDAAVHVLSCLYHLPCSEAVAMATELAANEKDAKLLERLRRVTERDR